MHHIISDEWSLRIFFEELGQLYKGFAEGSIVNLPDLPMRYTDYAVQQRQGLHSEAIEMEYWRRQLAGRDKDRVVVSDQEAPVAR